MTKRHLTLEQRAYAQSYGWGVLWAVVYVVLTPPQTMAVFLAPVLYLWGAVMVVSGGAAIRGALTGDHLVLERIALIVFRWTSLVYCLFTIVVLIGDLVSTGTSARWHVVLLGAWPFVILWKRAAYLRQKAEEARATPLPDEADV